MALTLEEALTELGILKGKVGPLEAERDRLLGHKERLETDLAKAKTRAETAEGERDGLKAKVPGDGTVVLSKADHERFSAYTALGKPDEIKAKLEAGESAARAVKTQANRDALATLGLKPSALRLREFDNVTVSAKKDGDTVTGTVKDGDAETSWEQWVKDKGLEADLKDFGLAETVTVVPALGQVGGNQSPLKTLTAEQVAEQKINSPTYSI